MENRILVDTSILINLQKGDIDTISNFEKVKDIVCISRITACEFIYGSKNSKEKAINKEFIDQIPLIEIDSGISNLTYKLIDEYGLKIKFGILDAIIASTSITHRLPIWTLNIKHFSQIKDLDFVVF